MTSHPKDRPETAEPFAALGQAMGELVHDLSNEVAVLQSWALLADGEIAAGRTPELEIKRVVELSRGLGHMLRDMLSALAEEGLSPEVQFDPAEATEAAISRRVRDLSGLTIRFHSELPRGTVLRGRSSFWTRTVANLVSNATRYARSEVLVALSLERSARPPAVLMRVEDDGPGIPVEEREQVFQPGWRGQLGGSGLGLSSVAWSVAQLGGEVAYRAGGSLGGAAFEVRVPLPTPVARPAAGREVAATAELAGHRLLIVDDDDAVRHVLSRLLRRVGAEVRELDPTGEPEEQLVLEILRTLPDVVLLDLRLGERGGLSLWEQLRAEVPRLAGLVVFVTGSAPGDPAWEAAARTGQPILMKPFEVGQLALAVRSLLPG